MTGYDAIVVGARIAGAATAMLLARQGARDMAAFRRVVAYAPSKAVALGLGMAGAIFGPRPGLTQFDFAICADQAGPLATDLGAPVLVEHDLDCWSRPTSSWSCPARISPHSPRSASSTRCVRRTGGTRRWPPSRSDDHRGAD